MYMPSTTLMLCMLHLILTTPYKIGALSSPFSDEETEAYIHSVMYPSSHSLGEAEPRISFRQ